jgi:hypothetical protein
MPLFQKTSIHFCEQSPIWRWPVSLMMRLAESIKTTCTTKIGLRHCSYRGVLFLPGDTLSRWLIWLTTAMSSPRRRSSRSVFLHLPQIFVKAAAVRAPGFTKCPLRGISNRRALNRLHFPGVPAWHRFVFLLQLK